MTLSNQLLLQYIYAAELVCFSLCMIALLDRNRAFYVWIASNLVAIVGTLCMAHSLVNPDEKISALGAGLAIISATMKATCFSGKILVRKSNNLPNVLAMITIVIGILIIILFDSHFRLFLIAISGMILNITCILYLFYNKSWAGLRPVYLLVIVFVTCFIGFIIVLSNTYPIGSVYKFVGSEKEQSWNVVMLCVFMFLFHMGFIGLTVARQGREQLLQTRRTGRVKAIAQQNAALADERYHLLKMLTHEVRQPLNTAQAALHTVVDQLSQGKTAAKQIQLIAMNAQTTLNSIVLSISNSILGATLITKGRPTVLEQINLYDVSQLALLDLDQSQRQRIQQSFEQPVIYADADPIVLRLAIRNLLENALKYSPADTSVLFELVADEERLAIVIRVTNELIDPAMLSDEIFERNRRGVDSQYAGYGLGLYIVKEVAEMHHGELGYHVADGKVAFELSIPA